MLGQKEPFDFINGSSVTIEAGDEAISPGGYYGPGDSEFGDIYEVSTSSGSCLAYFGQTGNGQVVVS